MSQMHQIQMSYVSTEDRILFRLNTKSRQEFRFWLTRRYTGILWNTLARILDEAGKGAKGTTPVPVQDELVKSAEKEIEHKKAVAEGDFDTAYEESSYLPLGEQPTLLFSVGVKPGPNSQAMLCMHPEEGEGIELVLNEQIVHSLCKLIVDTAGKAEWNLSLTFGSGLPDGKEPPTGLN